jgi:hypothetical protein
MTDWLRFPILISLPAEYLDILEKKSSWERISKY